MSAVSLAALRDAGVALLPHEAVAIAQLLIRHPDVSEPVAHAPYGPPTPESVEVEADGSVLCTCSATTPAVSEVAILLNALLPPEITRVPGGLRYAIGRALLEVEAPPFDSIEDFSRALARFERGDRREVVRGLVERSFTFAPAYADHSFSPAPAVITREPAKPQPFVERRRAGPRADELRRQLRDADRQFYEALVVFDDDQEPRPVAPPRWRAPAVVGAALAASIAIISVAQMVPRHRPAARAADSAASRPVPKPAREPQAPARETQTSAPAIVRTPAVHTPAPAQQQPVVDRERPQRSDTVTPAQTPPRAPRKVPEMTDTLSGPDIDALVPSLDAQRRPVFSPAFASNGTAMFFHTGRTAGTRSALMAVDIASPDLRIVSIVDDGARNYHVQPSPDDRFIAFDSDRDGERGVYVANRDGSRVHRVSGSGYAAVPSWAPDSRRLAFVRAEPANPKVWNLWLLALDTGELQRLTHYSFGQTWSASWFPDGRRICYSHEDKLVVLDLATKGMRQYDSPVPRRLVRTPAVSPDGSKVVFQVYRDGVWLLDLTDASTRLLLRDPTAEEFAWAPDGRRVAFHSRRDGQWGIYLLAPPADRETLQN
jgi:Tol biopolymer transport system component